MPETQVDLLLGSLVNASPKDDRALMEFPFFSLQKQPRMEPLVYDDGKVQIRIAPSEKGLATIWDKDVLIYAASPVNERIERGLPVEREIRFAAHDLLKVTGHGTGKRSYELLLDALDRLRNTSIQTSIEAGGERERRGFGWIEAWLVVERRTRSGRKIMAAIEITLNAWMFRALVKDRRVLTIKRAYFDLESGLGRRLYELATITPAAGYVSPAAAAAIGVLAGVVCYYAVALKNRMGWDDALDVWGVHGVGGVFGIVLLGVFGSTAWNPNGADGLLRGGAAFFGKQCVAVLVSATWAFAFTYAMLWLIDRVTPARVDARAQASGLDAELHGEEAYPQGL